MGDNVRNKWQWKTFGALAMLGAGFAFTGCKSAPELTQTQALALIQADYDHATPQGISILVNNDGMVQGALAKYWNRTIIYPNKYWADFKLTDEGKKVIKLPAGGDTIQWRPESLVDKNYTYRIVTVQANHLKAHDLGDIQDEMVASVDTAKGASFVEGVDLTGVPDILQQIAHEPGNRLSARRHADFALVNGAWTVHGIQ
jgi:hypothetical protein